MPYPKGHITEKSLKQFERVNKMLRDGDLKIKEACKEAGFSYTTYLHLKKRFKSHGPTNP
jgi:hypothetical protein